ncbi:ankyrin repeat domain-containing protein 50 [Biomphalaria glabrata]|nr:ankyrin repeat domain-containing protein 50 [Biomphalaria glabrata]
MVASHFGHLKTVKCLIDNNAKLNEQDHCGWTALMLASQNGHDDIAKLLMSSKSIDMSLGNSSGQNALIIASIYGRLEILKEILKHDPTLTNDKDHQGYTALMFAAQYNRALIVKLLLESGASLKCRGKDDLSALNIATMKGHRTILKSLLDISNFWSLPESDSILKITFLAVEKNKTGVARLLLNYRCDVNEKTDDGRTLLMSS